MSSKKKEKKKEKKKTSSSSSAEDQQPEDGPRPWYLIIPRPVRSAYRRVVPRVVRVFLRSRSRSFWIFFALYVVLQLLFNRLEFGLVFLVLAIIAAIFFNLDYSGNRRNGELSAYAAFNPGQQRLIGTYDTQQYEQMLRTGGMGATN